MLFQIAREIHGRLRGCAVRQGMPAADTKICSAGRRPSPVVSRMGAARANLLPQVALVLQQLRQLSFGKNSYLFGRLDVDGQGFRAADDDFITLLNFV